MRRERFFQVAACLAALAVPGASAHADNAPGALSRTEFWSDGPCLEAGYGTGMVRNICADRTITVMIPLEFNNNVVADVWAPTGTDVVCQLTSVDLIGGAGLDLGTQTVHGFGGATTRTMSWNGGEINDPGVLSLRCQLGFDGRVYSVRIHK
jgi:hypothetical protein